MEDTFYATGKRKSSIARTWLKPGIGKIVINKRPLEDYFTIATAQSLLRQPLELTNMTEKVDVIVTVSGGGIQGQSGAVRHGISKALTTMAPELRPVLKKAGLMTRDPRVKERKKYGQKGARARYQFSKR